MALSTAARNGVMAGALAAFVGSVYVYTMRAVGKNDVDAVRPYARVPLPPRRATWRARVSLRHSVVRAPVQHALAANQPCVACDVAALVANLPRPRRAPAGHRAARHAAQVARRRSSRRLLLRRSRLQPRAAPQLRRGVAHVVGGQERACCSPQLGRQRSRHATAADQSPGTPGTRKQYGLRQQIHRGAQRRVWGVGTRGVVRRQRRRAQNVLAGDSARTQPDRALPPR